MQHFLLLPVPLLLRVPPAALDPAYEPASLSLLFDDAHCTLEWLELLVIL